jgi:hypothetical protein
LGENIKVNGFKGRNYNLLYITPFNANVFWIYFLGTKKGSEREMVEVPKNNIAEKVLEIAMEE